MFVKRDQDPGVLSGLDEYPDNIHNKRSEAYLEERLRRDQQLSRVVWSLGKSAPGPLEGGVGEIL